MARMSLTRTAMAGAISWGVNAAYSAVVYVKKDATGSNNGTSWGNAFTTLQAGISAASSSDEVWVYEGDYYPTDPTLPHLATDRGATFSLKDGVAIYGGFQVEATIRDQRNANPASNNTRLSGDLGEAAPDHAADGDNSYRVVTGIEVGVGTILDGFTIAAGYAFDISQEPEGPLSGAGIYLLNSHAVIRNCIIRECHANNGAGVTVESTETTSEPLFEDVRFIGNVAKEFGGGLLSIASQPKISRAYFNENAAAGNGGGIFSGGAGGELDVRNSLFYDNYAGRGGAIEVQHEAYLDNITVTRNIAGTSGTGTGAGVYVHAVDPENPPMVDVRNSILWRNNPAQATQVTHYQIYGPATLTVMFSCIEDGSIGGSIPFDGASNGNIDADPQFANPGSSNFRLSAVSPPRDRGDSMNVALLDLDRDDRVEAGHVDMGAYEYTPIEGACCLSNGTCHMVLSPRECESVYVCDVAALLPGTFTGCYGDADGSGDVAPADRGHVAAAINQTDPELVCLFDLDGNGVINAGDKGVVSANLSQCVALPNWQNGSGCHGGTCPDPRFSGEFSEGTFCGMGTCTTGESDSFMQSNEPETSVEAGQGAWYSITLDYNDVEIDGAIVFSVSTSGAVIDDASGGLTVVTLGGSSGPALPARQFGAGYTRREMIEIDSPPSAEESDGELCSVELAEGATLRLEVYLWRDYGGGHHTVWAAGLVEE